MLPRRDVRAGRISLHYAYSLNNRSLPSRLSVNRIEGLIVPVPKQVGHDSVVSTSIAGRTLWRVICIRPNLLKGRMLCLARSLAIALVMCSNNFCRLAASAMSMKSTTIIPPISRRRSWRAISSAAAVFTSIAVFSGRRSLWNGCRCSHLSRAWPRYAR